jgi:hypothetical protein
MDAETAKRDDLTAAVQDFAPRLAWLEAQAGVPMPHIERLMAQEMDHRRRAAAAAEGARVRGATRRRPKPRRPARASPWTTHPPVEGGRI